MALHAARASDVQELISDFESNSALPWVTGTVALLAGLVVIGLQQEWRGAAAIIIGVLGVVTALEGVFLMGFPDSYLSFAGSIPLVAGAVVMGVVGLYLTYVGWVRND